MWGRYLQRNTSRKCFMRMADSGMKQKWYDVTISDSLKYFISFFMCTAALSRSKWRGRYICFHYSKWKWKDSDDVSFVHDLNNFVFHRYFVFFVARVRQPLDGVAVSLPLTVLVFAYGHVDFNLKPEFMCSRRVRPTTMSVNIANWLSCNDDIFSVAFL